MLLGFTFPVPEGCLDACALAEITEDFLAHFTGFADAFNQIVIFDALDAFCPDECHGCNIARLGTTSQGLILDAAVHY